MKPEYHSRCNTARLQLHYLIYMTRSLGVSGPQLLAGGPVASSFEPFWPALKDICYDFRVHYASVH